MMQPGKRPRPSMRRTASTAGFVLAEDHQVVANSPPRPPHLEIPAAIAFIKHQYPVDHDSLPEWGLNIRNTTLTASSADFSPTAMTTAPFLRACGLCKRRLASGRDIFMYRGEIAFCSSECRERRMNQDERKEKCSSLSSKKDSDASGTGGTVAAA
ncbi:hypothetical protein AXF42_Ash017893 [Apostasia shenzhenica]|uniref:FLZ-type domain-containing protein n=1 Tax=Apostasia shenzhenica TaxID=1088818 RepID=A0A2I0AY57_9ASPA|nr:hypothetical protein AXF42_Ash017893 [Apostasia shenzhenica]